MSEEQEQRWQRVADAVKAQLDQMVLTQKEFADLSGVGEDTLTKIVRVKQYSYRPTTLKKVALAFGWPPDALHRIADGEDPETFRQQAPAVPEGAAAYAERIAKADPQTRAAIDAILEADEARRGR